MSRMRPPLVTAVLLVEAGCAVRLPAPPALTLSIKADVGVKARGQAQVAPQAPVALEGAPVAEFFGIPLEGAQDVVFVLDQSGSMREPAQGQIAALGTGAPASQPSTPPPAPQKIDVAKKELIAALERLPAGTRMNIVFFNGSLEAFTATMAPLQDADRQAVVTFVTERTPSGPTALATALRAAFVMNARRIVLLSDGLGNVGGDSRSILRDAREAMRGGVRIDAIGLGKDQDAKLLRTLTTESGGIYQAF
jgi:Mg-chelatase subunit ChlD